MNTLYNFLKKITIKLLLKNIKTKNPELLSSIFDTTKMIHDLKYEINESKISSIQAIGYIIKGFIIRDIPKFIKKGYSKTLIIAEITRFLIKSYGINIKTNLLKLTMIKTSNGLLVIKISYKDSYAEFYFNCDDEKLLQLLDDE